MEEEILRAAIRQAFCGAQNDGAIPPDAALREPLRIRSLSSASHLAYGRWSTSAIVQSFQLYMLDHKDDKRPEGSAAPSPFDWGQAVVSKLAEREAVNERAICFVAKVDVEASLEELEDLELESFLPPTNAAANLSTRDDDQPVDERRGPHNADQHRVCDAHDAAATRCASADSEDPSIAVEVRSKGFINFFRKSDIAALILGRREQERLSISSPAGVPVVPTSAADESLSLPEVHFAPIGVIRSCYRAKFGTPRQGLFVPSSRGALCLKRSLGGECLDGLASFSHCWIIFVFDRNTVGKTDVVQTKVRPPKLQGKSVGVFASRSPHRPCNIGLTVAKIESVACALRRVLVSGIDIVDGTALLDIKPIHPMDLHPLAANAGDHRDTQSAPSRQKTSTAVKDDDSGGTRAHDEAVSHSARGVEAAASSSEVRSLKHSFPAWLTSSASQALGENRMMVTMAENVERNFREVCSRDNPHSRSSEEKEVNDVDADDEGKTSFTGGRAPFLFFENCDQFLECVKESLALDPLTVEQQRKRHVGATYQFDIDKFEVLFKVGRSEPPVVGGDNSSRTWTYEILSITKSPLLHSQLATGGQ